MKNDTSSLAAYCDARHDDYIAELTRVSMNIASSTYRPLEAYAAAGAFYLAINLCVAGLGGLAERRLAVGQAR